MTAPLLRRRYSHAHPVRIMLLPDTQVRAGVNTDHIKWAAQYATDKQPDYIVHIGDWGDFESLSSYHTALSKEGQRLRDDIDAVNASIALFDDNYSGGATKLFTMGNHEDRMLRYVADHPELSGTISDSLLNWRTAGWAVYPFLQPVEVNGLRFCHYFVRTAKGWAGKNPHPNAQTMTKREMASCVAGHSPGLDTYIHPTSSGMIRGLIAGSFYSHSEDWMGPQAGNYWRGLCMLHEVQRGMYSLSEISLDWLRRKYAK